jgi:hypothetical protein
MSDNLDPFRPDTAVEYLRSLEKCAQRIARGVAWTPRRWDREVALFASPLPGLLKAVRELVECGLAFDGNLRCIVRTALKAVEVGFCCAGPPPPGFSPVALRAIKEVAVLAQRDNLPIIIHPSLNHLLDTPDQNTGKRYAAALLVSTVQLVMDLAGPSMGVNAITLIL